MRGSIRLLDEVEELLRDQWSTGGESITDQTVWYGRPEPVKNDPVEGEDERLIVNEAVLLNGAGAAVGSLLLGNLLALLALVQDRRCRRLAQKRRLSRSLLEVGVSVLAGGRFLVDAACGVTGAGSGC